MIAVNGKRILERKRNILEVEGEILMKTLFIFYSYTGNTKRLAQELLAGDIDADITEIKDIRRPGKLKAYSLGCLAAMRGKAWTIQPLEVDLTAYEHLTLLAPVWAGNPPPAFNGIFEQLPEGKTVSIKMISASGNSNCRERLEAVIKAKGGILNSFEDIKV